MLPQEMANAHWMAQLPKSLDDLPVINLAIPGTHNSMTYGINRKSPLAADADKITRRLYKVAPCVVRRWAITQSQSILNQLELGVRYFDLRIVAQDDDYYYAHGLRSMKWHEPLIQLRAFLDEHSMEFVILDFQHSYNMTNELHYKLQQKLLHLFGGRLWLPQDGSLNKCTLTRARDLNKRILIIYRRCPNNFKNIFWCSNYWPTPWPNVASCTKLCHYLEMGLLSRNINNGYVSQCIITPTARYICLRIFSSLRSTSKKVNRKLLPWINSQTPGTHEKAVNVILGDFVDLKNGQFCQHVIDLNKKLL